MAHSERHVCTCVLCPTAVLVMTRASWTLRTDTCGSISPFVIPMGLLFSPPPNRGCLLIYFEIQPTPINEVPVYTCACTACCFVVHMCIAAFRHCPPSLSLDLYSCRFYAILSLLLDHYSIWTQSIRLFECTIQLCQHLCCLALSLLASFHILVFVVIEELINFSC